MVGFEFNMFLFKPCQLEEWIRTSIKNNPRGHPITVNLNPGNIRIHRNQSETILKNFNLMFRPEGNLQTERNEKSAQQKIHQCHKSIIYI